jgi:hypothetical protein
MERELRELEKRRQRRSLSQGAQGGKARITRLKVLEARGRGPYTLWVWASLPHPIGNVEGLCLRVWDNRNGIHVTDDQGQQPLPYFFQLLWDGISPHWEELKELSKSGEINPTSGYRRGVGWSKEIKL